MKSSKSAKPSSIVNTQARRDYELKQTYQAGIALSGAEVKSLRTGHGHLRGAFVNIKDGELWLYNATVNATNANRSALPETQQTRARKLLVKKRELAELATAKEQGLTIIPLKLHTGGRFIKVDIATAKGLRKYDKRQVLKKRAEVRDIERALKSR
jgi:SsrA-binding protein